MSGLMALAACFARALGFCSAAPLIGDEEVTARSRLAMAALLALFLAPSSSGEPGWLALPVEALGGYALGALISLLWSTLDSVLVPLAPAAGLASEEPFSLLSRLAGVASFLALSGDHYLIELLAGPALPLSRHGLAQAAMGAGRAVFERAAQALLPLLGTLVLAQLVVALLGRAATLDLNHLAAPALIALAFLLAGAWVGEAPALYRTVLETRPAGQEVK